MEGVRVLGPVSVFDGVRWTSPGGPSRQTFLALLVVARGRVVAADELVELTDRSSPDAGHSRSALRNEIRRIRAALTGTGVELRTRPGGYELLTPPGTIDVVDFEEAVAAAKRSEAADPAAGIGHAERALSHWRGRPFGGLGDGCERLAVEERRLTELFVATAERRLACLLASGGDLNEVAADAERLATEQPLREGPVAILMQALFGAGRQVEALAAYQDLRRRLIEEIGAEPTSELRQLEARILNQDPMLSTRRSSQRRPQLPSYATSFVGRDADCDSLRAAVAEHRLVTIVGPGGAGKTRLAIEVARSMSAAFGGDVAHLELASVDTKDAVQHRVAAVLGVTPRDDVDLVDAVIGAVEHRRCLLIADNCEHVLESVREVFDRMLASATSITVLATSRVRLGLARERAWPIPPLASGTAAVALFCDRAQAALPSFEAAGDEAVIAELCQRVDHLPLAIELLAARSPALSPRQLLDLADRGALLEPAPAHSDRHRDLRSAIDWSVQLLGEGDRRVLARMSVFAGSTDLADIAAVCEPEAEGSDVTRAVARLVDASLVGATRHGDAFRYSLLDTVRAHSAERLEASGDAASVTARHAGRFLARARELRARLRSYDEVAATTELDLLWPNVRGAFNHSIATNDADLGSGLVDAIGIEAHIRERFEVGDWIDRLVTLDRFEGAHAAQVLALGAVLDAMIGNWDRSIDRTRRAVRLADHDGAARTAELGLAHCWATIVTQPVRVEDIVQMRSWARDAGRAGDAWGALKTRLHMEMALHTYLGRHADARRTLAMLAPAVAELANPHLDIELACSTAIHAAAPHESVRLWRAAIERIENARSTWTLTPAANYLGASLLEAGRHDEALDVVRWQVRRLLNGASRQSLAATVRNCIVLFDHLGWRSDAAALAAWLAAQQAKVPSTPAIMRLAAAASRTLDRNEALPQPTASTADALIELLAARLLI